MDTLRTQEYGRSLHARKGGDLMVRTMKAVVPAVAVALVALVVAAPSSAVTTLNVNAAFTEPLGGPMHSPFSCVSGDLCGTGKAGGLGRISESIVFGGGCGGA